MGGRMTWRRAPRTSVALSTILLFYDLAATAMSVVVALMLRFETLNFAESVLPYLPMALAPLIVRPPVGIAMGLYRREWRFASTRELRDVALATVIGSVIIVLLYGAATAVGVAGTAPFPRSYFIIEPLITLALVGAIRFALRMRAERAVRAHRQTPAVRTLIYGAGEAGAGVARSSARDPQLGIEVVGFLDDERRKHGSRLFGQRVYGALDDLESIVRRTDARQLLIAMPSRSGLPLRRAVAAGQELGLEVKTVPPITDLLTGQLRYSRPRSISVEDLLRRPPVDLDIQAIAKYLNGASVLVTGGGGSIGGELVKQILRLGPRVLTVVDCQESALWGMERDAAASVANSGVRLNPVLADVRSAPGIDAVIRRARPDVVFHAAALKHVPYVELHASQGVLTNVMGTQNVLRACEAAGVRRFVLISTDKAVEAASIMGATKRIAEVLTVRAGRRTGLPYSTVRFGNVLGSSGSLVPLLERQLDDGLPLTITEPDATRYFMTLTEAVTLILEAGAAASPGDLFVLDMGQPVRIGDLVADVLRLRGLEEGEIEVMTVGLRPGEKLHEQLLFDDERAERTNYPGILRAVGNRAGDTHDDRRLDHLIHLAELSDDAAVRSLLQGLPVSQGGLDRGKAQHNGA